MKIMCISTLVLKWAFKLNFISDCVSDIVVAESCIFFFLKSQIVNRCERRQAKKGGREREKVEIYFIFIDLTRGRSNEWSC